MINLSLNTRNLTAYVIRLLNNYLPDEDIDRSLIDSYIDSTIQRLEFSFCNIKKKYYYENGMTVFNHLNSDHFCCFLYFLANTIWNETGDDRIPTKLFYLNKIMHGLDLFYSIKMPAIFMLVHPLGTILGNAVYSDYFVCYQNCTVGADGLDYPVFGKGTVLFAKSAVIGKSNIGDNVVFGANSFLINTDVISNKVVLGQFPNNVIKDNKREIGSGLFY